VVCTFRGIHIRDSNSWREPDFITRVRHFSYEISRVAMLLRLYE
jgi:hypothetical protein